MIYLSCLIGIGFGKREEGESVRFLTVVNPIGFTQRLAHLFLSLGFQSAGPLSIQLELFIFIIELIKNRMPFLGVFS